METKVTLFVLKKYFRCSIAVTGVVLIHKGFHLADMLQHLMDLLAEHTLAHAVNDDEAGLSMRYGSVELFMKFRELDRQHIARGKTAALFDQFLDMQV